MGTTGSATGAGASATAFAGAIDGAGAAAFAGATDGAGAFCGATDVTAALFAAGATDGEAAAAFGALGGPPGVDDVVVEGDGLAWLAGA